MNVTLQLFGAFRNYGQSVELELPEQLKIKDLREALAEALSDKEDNKEALKKMIDSSRFATDKAILEEDAVVEHGLLSILPPVSGGKS